MIENSGNQGVVFDVRFRRALTSQGLSSVNRVTSWGWQARLWLESFQVGKWFDLIFSCWLKWVQARFQARAL